VARRRADAERGAAAQLLVLRARRRLGTWRCGTASASSHVLVESDYPHADSSWPDTQAMLVRQLRDQGVPDDEAERITWRNAAELFRHPVPPPTAFP
jgi:hypothetical protein